MCGLIQLKCGKFEQPICPNLRHIGVPRARLVRLVAVSGFDFLGLNVFERINAPTKLPHATRFSKCTTAKTPSPEAAEVATSMTMMAFKLVNMKLYVGAMVWQSCHHHRLCGTCTGHASKNSCDSQDNSGELKLSVAFNKYHRKQAVIHS